MKKVILVILTCLLFFLFYSSSYAVSIELLPSMNKVLVGEAFNLDLVISDLGNFSSPSVGGFDLDVTFDPYFISFVDYSLGSGLGDPFLSEAIDFSLGEIYPGLINLNELSLLDPNTLNGSQSGSFSLATISFLGENVGTNEVDFGFIDITDEFGDSLTVTSTNSANVSVVPEPATIFLMAAGAAGLGVFGRKKIKARK